MLHNPRYAGAFAYGRTRTRHRPDGGITVVKVARGSSSCQARTRATSTGNASKPTSGGSPTTPAPSATIGDRVRRVKDRHSSKVACSAAYAANAWVFTTAGPMAYICQETAVRRAGKTCQTVPGMVVDAAVADLLIQMMTPVTVAVTLEVQRELEARAAETDAVRRQHVERMRYEAELARRRYMKVEPHNRLVADTLEAEWKTSCAAMPMPSRIMSAEANSNPPHSTPRPAGLSSISPSSCRGSGITHASTPASANASCVCSSTK